MSSGQRSHLNRLDESVNNDGDNIINKYDGREEPSDHSEHVTPFVVGLASFAAIGGFLFGYDTGVVSGAMLLIKDRFSLSSLWQELVVSITIGTAFVAALMGGALNDWFGRKTVILVASFIFTGGAVVLGVAQNVAMLVAGRAVLGLGIGFASMTVPVYIAESAPVSLRGRLVTINNIFITGGQCVASFVDAGFSYLETDGWRYMLGLAGIPAIVQFVGFLFLPESPRWLLTKGREDEAREVLRRIRGTDDVERELKDVRSSLEMEATTSKASGSTIIRVFRTPTVRRAVIVGCGLQLFQQLSGINTVMYYSASIISMSGVSDQHEAIFLAAGMASVNFLFTFVGLWLVERIGRKKLIMVSLFDGAILAPKTPTVGFASRPSTARWRVRVLPRTPTRTPTPITECARTRRFQGVSPGPTTTVPILTGGSLFSAWCCISCSLLQEWGPCPGPSIRRSTPCGPGPRATPCRRPLTGWPTSWCP